jgi:hypothetical protein
MTPRVKRGRRIVVLCEGKTEERAIRFFVARQWALDGLSAVGLDRVDLRGHLDKVAPFARNHLDEPEVLAVFTLIDLYGMTSVTHPANDELDAKVQRVQNWLRDRLGQHKRADYFVPHVSVHEVEAWILAEGAALARRLGDPWIRPDPQAEVKNFQNPPSRRMSELFLKSKGRHYQKIEDGEPLFSQMEFQPVYTSCPYFRKFYDDLKVAGRS